MSKKRNLYSVGYTQNGEALVADNVDLFDLPYDKCNDDEPLWIMSDVDMGKSKNRTWPNFKNVCIFGALDCSDFTITPQTILPDCFDKLICKHSINDLGVLIGILPNDFMTAKKPEIVVRNAIFTNIKKNVNGAQDVARKFVAMYPNVIVTNESCTLTDILNDIDVANSVSKKDEKTVAKTTKKTALPIKTEEWYTADQIMIICKTNAPELTLIPDDELARYIKMSRSAKADLNLRVAEMIRPEDDAVVICFHRDEVDRVTDYVCTRVAEQGERCKKETTKNKTPRIKTVTQKQKSQMSQKSEFFVSGRGVRPIKIIKYISRITWGQILSKVGNSVDTLLNILHDIDNININPTDTNGKQVVFIQDKQIKISPTIKFKNSKCLAQGFGTLDDRPRIIWEMSGNVFVCQKFFAEHDTHDKKYQKYLREANLDLSKIDLSDFYQVSDLINELTTSKPRPDDGDEDDDKPAASKPTPDVEPKTESTSQEPVQKPKRTRIVRKTTEPVRPKNKTANIAEQKPAEKAAEVKDEKTQETIEFKDKNSSVVQWTQVYSLSHQYEQKIAFLTAQQKLLVQLMTKETDTEKMIQLTQQLHKVLFFKKACECAVEKMQSINQELHKLQQDLIGHKL